MCVFVVFILVFAVYLFPFLSFTPRTPYDMHTCTLTPTTGTTSQTVLPPRPALRRVSLSARSWSVLPRANPCNLSMQAGKSFVGEETRKRRQFVYHGWLSKPTRPHTHVLAHKHNIFRYAGNKPDPQLQGDLQAWRAALNNLRAQREQQGNK